MGLLSGLLVRTRSRHRGDEMTSRLRSNGHSARLIQISAMWRARGQMVSYWRDSSTGNFRVLRLRLRDPGLIHKA
jgi:hypothetical protein